MVPPANWMTVAAGLSWLLEAFCRCPRPIDSEYSGAILDLDVREGVMDWYLALWTGMSWMFSGGILYLVYRFGLNSARERGLRVESWRSIVLLLGFVVAVAMFGTDYPDQGLLVAFDDEDRARFVGVFTVIVAAYLFGFIDGKQARRFGKGEEEKDHRLSSAA
jgi:hypothetical protein